MSPWGWLLLLGLPPGAVALGLLVGQIQASLIEWSRRRDRRRRDRSQR